MKINFNQPFKDFLGEAVIGKDGKPMMINRVLGLQLFNLSELKGNPLTPDQKYRAYTLSVKLANEPGEIEFSPEEIEFIDQVSSEVYSAGAYGNIKELLTPKQ